MVCSSSTSGTRLRWRRTRSPTPWVISRVTKAVTGKPMAAGSTSGPKPRITPRTRSFSSRACAVPRATPSRRLASSTPIRGSRANSSISRASNASMAICRPFRTRVPRSLGILRRTTPEARVMLYNMPRESANYCTDCRGSAPCQHDCAEK